MMNSAVGRNSMWATKNLNCTMAATCSASSRKRLTASPGWGASGDQAGPGGARSIALQHRADVEVAVVMEHDAAHEHGERHHTDRDQDRAQLPDPEGDARLARELVEYLPLDQPDGVLQDHHPEDDHQQLGQQRPLQGPEDPQQGVPGSCVASPASVASI